MSYNNRQDFKRKRKTSYAIKIIAAILAVALLCGVGVVLFSNGFLQKRNDKNLIGPDSENYIKTQGTKYGVDVEVKEDGTIKLKGNPSGNIELVVDTVELEAGTYTLSAIKEPDLASVTLSAQWNVTNFCYAGFGDEVLDDTFTLTEKTTVSVILSIQSEAEIAYANRTIRPVLVSGDTAGDFYA